MEGIQHATAQELEVILGLVASKRKRLPDKPPSEAIELAPILDSIESKAEASLTAINALARFRSFFV